MSRRHGPQNKQIVRPETGRQTMIPTGEGGSVPVQVVADPGVAMPRNLNLMEIPQVREMASLVGAWQKDATRREARLKARMFGRDTYVSPDNPYDLIRVARTANEDDSAVSGVADARESLMFTGQKFESGDNPDEADVWNQWAAKVNFDDFIRKLGREDGEIGQAITAADWGWFDFTPRGTGEGGRKRRATYHAWMPKSLKIVDAQYVVPIGRGVLGPDRLAWMADEAEIAEFINSPEDDPMRAYYKGKYTPGPAEMMKLQDLGVATNTLLELNPTYVWRHAPGLQDYKLHPMPKVASVLRELDLKRQLMDADRAALVANANFIVLVRIGSDAKPGTNNELAKMRENWNFLAKSSVVIGDNRLDIQIIAPKVDFTLQPEKYQELNRTIINRLLGMPHAIGSTENSAVAAGKFISASLENSRKMLTRSIEEHIVRAVKDHPNNADVFKSEPNLVFTPRKIMIDMDTAYITAVASARDKKELSRESYLDILGFDQETEAGRREHEKDSGLDDTFGTQVPFSATNGAPPSVSGPTGGRPQGGGDQANNATDLTAQTPAGNKSTSTQGNQ